MATTLKARAGSSCKATFSYVDPDGEPIDVTGYTVRFQLRAATGQSRVLLQTQAPSDNLIDVSPAVWQLFLGKTITETLPPKARWELELVSTTNPEDVSTLGTGILLTEPQVVTND